MGNVRLYGKCQVIWEIAISIMWLVASRSVSVKRIWDILGNSSFVRCGRIYLRWEL